jgi:Cu/Ag efflux pump CusA
VVGDLAGKELERPMAHVILGGLFTSTFLNMIVVPTYFAKWGWEREETFARQTAALDATPLGDGSSSR